MFTYFSHGLSQEPIHRLAVAVLWCDNKRVSGFIRDGAGYVVGVKMSASHSEKPFHFS